MAKSFHNILKEGIIEVSHRGEEITLDLPQWLCNCSHVLMDEEELVAWAMDEEVLHGLLHSGIQQEIIRIRAAARPSVNTKDDTSKSIIDEKANCQERIDDYVCKPTPPPGTSSKASKEETELKAALNMTNSMLKAGLLKEQVITIVNDSEYSGKIKTMIIETLN